MALEHEWNISKINGERKITTSDDYHHLSSLKVLINGNNSVGSQSSLHGKVLGWWLATVNGPRLRLDPLTEASHQPGHYHAVKTGSPHRYPPSNLVL